MKQQMLVCLSKEKILGISLSGNGNNKIYQLHLLQFFNYYLSRKAEGNGPAKP